MELIDIFNIYKEIIYEWKYIEYEDRIMGKIACRLDKNNCHIISLNDLLSTESGFLQAVKRKKWVKFERILSWDVGKHETSEMLQWYDSLEREYHAMVISILSNEDKVKYLEKNILID